ncbi:MAG: hypothetical protein QG629_448 [Patescibacteria group bacterium]|nr:hypothetical protein [Patescibacteria group bacterium]
MNDQNQPGYQHNPNIQPYTTGAQPNNGHNPYEFIMQANAKPPKAGPSFAVRLMVVVGGIFLLFVGIAVALSLINGGQDDTERFTAVAKEQQQIVLLATTVTQNAKSDSAKAFALNTQLSLQTSLAQTQDFMKKNEMKLDDKALSQTSNKDATDALASAKESQDYDTQAR